MIKISNECSQLIYGIVDRLEGGFEPIENDFIKWYQSYLVDMLNTTDFFDKNTYISKEQFEHTIYFVTNLYKEYQEMFDTYNTKYLIGLFNNIKALIEKERESVMSEMAVHIRQQIVFNEALKFFERVEDTKETPKKDVIRSGVCWSILYSQELSQSEKMVFIALKDRAYQVDKTCVKGFYCYLDWLEANLNMSDKTVQKAIRGLREKNIISSKRVKLHKKVVNQWTINWNVIDDMLKQFRFKNTNDIYNEELPF